MIGNTDFMFDGPRSRENLSIVNECEQLVRNPPEEFQNSTILQYFTGRLFYLKVCEKKIHNYIHHSIWIARRAKYILYYVECIIK